MPLRRPPSEHISRPSPHPDLPHPLGGFACPSKPPSASGPHPFASSILAADFMATARSSSGHRSMTFPISRPALYSLHPNYSTKDRRCQAWRS